MIEITYKQAAMAADFRYLLLAAKQDGLRYKLDGVYVDCTEGETNLVATDGRRLHYVRPPAMSEKQEKQTRREGSALLPRDACKFIADLPQAGGSDCTITIDDGAIKIEGRKGRRGEVPCNWIGNVVDHRYPRWRYVVQLDTPNATFIGRASDVAKYFEPFHGVRLVVNGDVKSTIHDRRSLPPLTEVKGEANVLFDPEFMLDAIGDSSEGVAVHLFENEKHPGTGSAKVCHARAVAVVMGLDPDR